MARGVGHGMTRKSTEREREEILARAGFTTEATEGTKVFWRVARVGFNTKMRRDEVFVVVSYWLLVGSC